MIHVIAAEGGIAAGGEHFEHPPIETQQRNIEGAAAKVIHGNEAIAALVEAIGNRRGRGFVQQAQQVKPGEPGGIPGCLALGVVKISRHGNYDTVQIVVQTAARTTGQRDEQLGRDFDGRQIAAACTDTRQTVLRIRGKFIGQDFSEAIDVFEPAAHQPLDGRQRIERILCLQRKRIVTGYDPLLTKMDDRRQ